MKAIADLRHRLADALTRFKPRFGRDRAAEEGDTGYLPTWGMLAGEVFEDRAKVVVRLEAPGMTVRDFELEVQGETLHVRGEKRVARESGDGRYQLLECAYGSFERTIPLPAAVRADKAQATYRSGVLRIELPKQRDSEPRRLKVKVH